MFGINMKKRPGIEGVATPPPPHIHHYPWVHIQAGPDLGLGNLGYCPGASTTRGPPHMSCHLLFFGILG